MSGTVRFGLYTADLRAGELRKGDDPVPLQNLPLRLLALLLREPGRLVTREEIREALWPADIFLDFERGISTAVSKVRDALGDSATNPRFVQTVGRRGYRFIAPVTLAEPAPAVRTEGATALAPETQARVAPQLARAAPQARPWYGLGKRPAYAAMLLGLAAVLALAIRWQAGREVPRHEIKSLAVLPFENLSGDPQQEYLSDGMTDAVTTSLAQVADLRVISRTTSMHYKRTQKTAPEIARELGVDALVEGSVMRSGDQLRLTVQLIQTRDDRHLWASSYDRELANALLLQDELAREIAGQIQLRLTPEQEQRLAKGQRVDPETYILYLQGRFYWNQRKEQDLTKAIACFEEALRRDPNFAPAYAGLADSYVVLPFFSPTASKPLYAKAHEAASQALALDPSLAEAHNSEAYARMYRDWDFKGAEEEFQKALAINPNYATAHQWYAELLSLEGRHQEAIAQITRALELDPQSAVVHHQAGQVFRAAKQYPRAMAEYRESLQLDPQFYQNDFAIYRLYRESGDHDKAIEQGLYYMHYVNPACEEAFAKAVRAYRAGGWNAFLRKSSKTWELSGWEVASYYESWDYASLGQFDSAIRVLEQEYAHHNPMMLSARTDPELDPLRSDPRFQALLRKIGQP